MQDTSNKVMSDSVVAALYEAGMRYVDSELGRCGVSAGGARAFSTTAVLGSLREGERQPLTNDKCIVKAAKVVCLCTLDISGVFSGGRILKLRGLE